jgi:phosphoenolpyruvate carboxylase
VSQIKSQFPNAVREENPLIRLGFWPGGDRDGNLFVTSDITLQVANALQNRIIRC